MENSGNLEEDESVVSALPEAEEIIETESWAKKEDDEDEVNAEDVDDEDSQGVSAYGISASSGIYSVGSKRGLPKLREILRRQKQDSEVSCMF
jgi:hypothetical protein